MSKRTRAEEFLSAGDEGKRSKMEEPQTTTVPCMHVFPHGDNLCTDVAAKNPAGDLELIQQTGSFCFLYAVLNSATHIPGIDAVHWVSLLQKMYPDHDFRLHGSSAVQLQKLLGRAQGLGIIQGYLFKRLRFDRGELGFFHFLRMRSRDQEQYATSSWILVGIAPSTDIRRTTITKVKAKWDRMLATAFTFVYV